jgi:uncharacterized membrane protein
MIQQLGRRRILGGFSNNACVTTVCLGGGFGCCYAIFAHGLRVLLVLVTTRHGGGSEDERRFCPRGKMKNAAVTECQT